jgi:hypothetical protein
MTSADVSEEHNAFIFRVEYAKNDVSVKPETYFRAGYLARLIEQ